jgi:stage V sporulation protein AC
MDQNKYKTLVDRHTPKEDKLFNILKAFLVGGSIGIIGQLIIDFFIHVLDVSKKEAGTYMIITLIIIASIFTAIGFFDTLVSKVRAGIIVPITGFAHSMTSAALEYKREGLVTGIGANIFKLSGTVILYGVVSAYVFGLIRVLLFGGS